jgi:hypothetical protein
MMSVNYATSLLTSRLQVVINDIDDGATNGNMRLLDSGGNILSSLQLARPMGVASAGVLTFLGLSLIDPAASASGVAALARIEDGDGNTVISGLTVGTGAVPVDIVMSPTNTIVAGQTVAITAATITGN